jgi:hypothetical protein
MIVISGTIFRFNMQNTSTMYGQKASESFHLVKQDSHR